MDRSVASTSTTADKLCGTCGCREYSLLSHSKGYLLPLMRQAIHSNLFFIRYLSHSKSFRLKIGSKVTTF